MPLERPGRAELKDHLRKWLWLYILCAALLLFANRIIFDITRPTLPEENILRIYAVGISADEAALAGAEEALLPAVQAAAPAIQKIEILSLPYSGDGTSSTDMLLTARLTLGDGDAFLCSPTAFERLVQLGACLPLEDILAGGCLAGLEAVTAADESGVEYIAAVRIPDGHPIAAAFEPCEKYLVVPAYSASLAHALTNLTALDALFAAG